MPGRLVPLILAPRYSALSGASEFRYLPVDVSGFAAARVTLWRGSLSGTTPTFTVFIEYSTDKVSWVSQNGPGYDSGANATLDVALDLSRRWMRARVVLGGADPAATWWCAGMAELRER